MGYRKDESSPDVDVENPHDYTIMSKPVLGAVSSQS